MPEAKSIADPGSNGNNVFQSATEFDADHVVIDGPPRVAGLMRSALLAADVVDELCLTVSPLIVGGDSGRIAKGAVPEPRAMSLAGILQSENTLLLRYVRAR